LSTTEYISALLEQKPMTKRGQRTTDNILAAAREVFEEVGYEKATTAEISRRAQVAEGTLFLHFKSKIGLMQTMMIAFYRELYDEGVQQAVDAEPIERLHEMLTHYIKKLEANWPTIKIFASHGRIGSHDSMEMFRNLNKYYTDLYVELLETLQKQDKLKRSIRPQTIRDTLFGAIEHYAISQFVPGRDVDTTVFLEELWALVFEGILTDKSRSGIFLEQIDQKLNRLLDAEEP
jgi:AcrR family transcriptional regulator